VTAEHLHRPGDRTPRASWPPPTMDDEPDGHDGEPFWQMAAAWVVLVSVVLSFVMFAVWALKVAW
jgi:hypothetical protein